MPRLGENYFSDGVFPIDKAAGSCYNGFDSADFGEAPILADPCAVVNRKFYEYVCARSGLATDKTYYVKSKNVFKSITYGR